MIRPSRRSFLWSSLSGAAGLALSARSYARVLGSNEELRLGFVGLRSRGAQLLAEFKKIGGVRVVGLCDVDAKVRAQRVGEAEKRGEQVFACADARELFAREDVDAVVIATPNHTHSLLAIWALQAGKHVYVEKPVSHNVWEGRQLVGWAQKTGRLCEAGTQSRSSAGLQEAAAYLRSGALGKPLAAHGLCYKPRRSIGVVEGDVLLGAEIDYDLWSGPAPKVPLRRKNLHYDWHWVFATGNGDLGNQGIHQMDIARWMLGYDALPPRVLSIGGRVGYRDDGDTPNTQLVLLDYASAPIVFEVRGLPESKELQDERWEKSMPSWRGARVGVVVLCEGGSLVIPNYTSARALDPEGKELAKFQGEDALPANFVAAVQANDARRLAAPVLEGHLSSALCHLGNISYQLGSTAGPEELRARARSSAPLEDAYARMEEHLVKNGIEPGAMRLGAALELDAPAERFRGAPEADALLTRAYRAPYVVPAADA
ncbi:MAG: Gfo/Idh/MocA family oxidoreductase [Planctomycetes bacterium]|nr:Gfo/Idh/MocA family oxidoreductase [Planctomycetota bacterium]